MLAWGFERVMPVPLISLAQVFMLSESMEEALPAEGLSPLPDDLTPKQRFTDEHLRLHLPVAKAFGLQDFGCCVGRSRSPDYATGH
jgi:hypothetical protein